MDNNTRFSRREGLMTADMDGSAVMMDIMTGKYYNLGDIGGRIWELLEESMTLQTLVEKLTAEYDVAPEQCKTDIQPFLAALVERGLLIAD